MPLQDRLVAGDTINYAASVPQYPVADGWALKVRLVPRFAGTAITVTSTPNAADNTYVVQADSATTSGWAAGNYGWSAWVEKAGERYTVESGQIVIDPDPETVAAGTDLRSPTRQALDAVTATLQGRATDAVQRYQINGREVWRYSLTELLQLQTTLQLQLAAEERAAGIANAAGTIKRVFIRTA